MKKDRDNILSACNSPHLIRRPTCQHGMRGYDFDGPMAREWIKKRHGGLKLLKVRNANELETENPEFQFSQL